MQTYARDAEVQESASKALGSLCKGCKARRDEALSLGGLTLVIQALKGHPEQAILQAHGCFALSMMCWQCHNSKAEAFSLGGIELLIKAMQDHHGNSSVQFYASSALASMCHGAEECRRRALALGALELLLQILQHVTDPGVLTRCSEAVGSICFGFSTAALERQAHAIGLGAFDLIVKALPRAPCSSDYICFWALGCLCSGSDEAAVACRRRAVDLGVLEQVQLMLEHEIDLQEEGRAVLDLFLTTPTGEQAAKTASHQLVTASCEGPVCVEEASASSSGHQLGDQ
ncbi:Protein aardvark (Suppressor of amiB protein 16) [Durusdinium trenchii]|uniref:Protein aardvark (Suppressor of amiB protein 16) n=1 Tax=Durusdinium trenchii TaxID=1381693 RepID=A0ABP0LXV3_9DINO